MEVCYWALLFMPLVILHHLLNVFVQLANKMGFTKKKKKKSISASGTLIGTSMYASCSAQLSHFDVPSKVFRIKKISQVLFPERLPTNP
jgi:hypothetical protein